MSSCPTLIIRSDLSLLLYAKNRLKKERHYPNTEGSRSSKHALPHLCTDEWDFSFVNKCS